MPGHTPGSVALLDSSNRLLFTGDAIAGTGKGKVHDFVLHDSSDDVSERLRGAEKVLTLPFDSVYPFHYEPLVGTASEVLTKFVNEKKEEV